jgi:hypothetical protein
LEFTSRNFQKLDGQFSPGFSRKSCGIFRSWLWNRLLFANYNSLLIIRVKVWLENFMVSFWYEFFMMGGFLLKLRGDWVDKVMNAGVLVHYWSLSNNFLWKKENYLNKNKNKIMFSLEIIGNLRKFAKFWIRYFRKKSLLVTPIKSSKLKFNTSNSSSKVHP